MAHLVKKTLVFVILIGVFNSLKANNMKTIIIGGGCFWCLEAVFSEVPGVQDAVSGYAGGHVKNPAYREVCNGSTGHAEVIKIVYNTEKVSLDELLQVFFMIHDPTTPNRQGNDVGTQYRSIIFYNNEIEKDHIINYINGLEKSKKFKDRIVTELKENETFYEAETYHQNYFRNNKDQPYCKFVIDPKLTKWQHFKESKTK